MKSAFITGANRGLGYGFVQHLLKRGFLVFAGTRKISIDLPQDDNLFWIECDVTDNESIDRVISKIKEKTDTITFLINNAGVNKGTIPEGNQDFVSKLESLDRKALLNMFNINSVSPIIVTKKFLPLLSSNPCFVINISSARASFSDGHSGSTANYGYAASKLALNMFTFCSEVDLPKNVKTFAVNPGGVRTEMNPSRGGEPLDKAEQIIKIVDNWKEEYNGKFLHVDGSLYSL